VGAWKSGKDQQNGLELSLAAEKHVEELAKPGDGEEGIVVGGGRGARKNGRRHASGGAPGPRAPARGFRPWKPPGGIFV
jgi:hypothetical protein